jgi:hypothetical protein
MFWGWTKCKLRSSAGVQGDFVLAQMTRGHFAEDEGMHKHHSGITPYDVAEVVHPAQARCHPGGPVAMRFPARSGP